MVFVWLATLCAIAQPDLARALDAVSRAGLYADKSAYEEAFFVDDPALTVERQRWLDRVRRQNFVEYELRITGEPTWFPDDDTPTSAVARVRETWRESDDRRTRIDEYAGRFVLRDGVWRFAGRAWVQLPGEGMRILGDATLFSKAQKIKQRWPEVRRVVDARLGLAGPEDILITLYPTGVALAGSIGPGASGDFAGWHEPGESLRMVVDADDLDDALGVLAHEYAHALTFHAGRRATDLPWWLLEGIAEHAAEPFSGTGDAFAELVRAWHRNAELVDLDTLGAPPKRGMTRAGFQAYAQGQKFMQYIADRHAPETLAAWIRAMATHGQTEPATQDALGEPLDALIDSWRASLAQD